MKKLGFMLFTLLPLLTMLSCIGASLLLRTKPAERPYWVDNDGFPREDAVSFVGVGESDRLSEAKDIARKDIARQVAQYCGISVTDLSSNSSRWQGKSSDTVDPSVEEYRTLLYSVHAEVSRITTDETYVEYFIRNGHEWYQVYSLCELKKDILEEWIAKRSSQPPSQPVIVIQQAPESASQPALHEKPFRN